MAEAAAAVQIDTADTGTTETTTTTQADTTQQDGGSSTDAGTKATTTFLDDKTDAGKATTVIADWPDDWRTKLASGDDKLLKQLERYASPKAFSDAHFALRQKVSSGELKAAKLPDDATDEQKAEWRKEQGIPEKADDYIADLPQGLVIGEEEKERVGDFLKDMHAAGAPKGFVQKALEWNQKIKEADQDRIFEANFQAQTATEDALRAELGGEYRPITNQIKALLAGAPQGVSDLLSQASGPDGVGLLNNIPVARWLVSLVKELQPVATLTGGAASGADIDTEISSLKALMGDRESAYWKGPDAEKKQARYSELLAAKERQK